MHREPRNGATIDRIYIHKNEGPEVVNGAHELGHYLDTIDGGYHAGVDNLRVACYAQDDEIVWAEGGDNLHALSIVLIGWSSSRAADYITDPYLRLQFELAAQQVAYWCGKYGIPVTRVAPGTPGHAPTQRGIAEHADDHDPHSGGHTDPGAGFPMDAFIKRVQQINTTPESLATLAIWKQYVTDHPLRFEDNSWAVTALKELLNHIHEGPNNTSTMYGKRLVACVTAFKVKHKIGNADGAVFGGAAADALFKLLG